MTLTLEKATPTGEVGARGNTTANGTRIINAATLNLQYSTFRSDTYKGITRHSRTWSYLVRTLEQVDEYAEKRACPMIKLATFGKVESAKGALRHRANMVEIYGIIGDYDGEQVSIARAADLLGAQGIEAFFYTSASHTIERPRWRVVVPLSQAYPVADHGRFVAMLNNALGGILAAESFQAAQCYYYGRVHGAVYETWRVQGDPLDLFDLVLGETYPEGKAATKDLTWSSKTGHTS